MKTQFLLRMSAIAAIAALTTVENVSAQGDAGKFLASGVSDGNTLINAYLSPMMKGFGQGLNDGWYNTAKPLGTGGFDIRINFGASAVPTKDQSFDLSSININRDQTKPYLRVPAGASTVQSSLYGEDRAKTVGGVKQNEVEIVVPITVQIPVDPTNPSGPKKDTTFNNITKMELPTGTGVAFTPSLPMAQLSVGVYKKTELTLRFLPQITAGDMKVSMFGLGIKHDIKQWIKPIKDQKWDWSVVAGYTSITSEFAFSKPLLEVNDSAYNPDPTADYKNQKLSFTGTAFMLGTMVSKQLGWGALNVTPYIGLNYAYSKVNLKMEGNFPIAGPNLNYNPDPTVTDPAVKKQTMINKAVDPVDLEGSLSNFRANAGLRIKLTLITISAEYSLGMYDSFTLGIGLNLQSMVPFKI